MPSGISHILLSRYLLNEFQKEGNIEIPQVLAAGMPFLLVINFQSGCAASRFFEIISKVFFDNPDSFISQGQSGLLL